ncbi:(2,3-dihydroxybenzoyl)adenylate synthase [Nocardioides humi]|uniref:(2,3-dihydroxybenzoyl)adenylate synthase n=1 Tax=Nocardioides humi TaxID=449461 RepID=A0ABN2AA52_9ACTN|nr:AMP-binding protein [Nocardioides humi]
MTAAVTTVPDVVPYPDDVVERYLAAGVWGADRLEDLLHHAVARWPERTAVVDGERRWTYAELAAAIERTRGVLAAQGVVPGDAVVLQLPNGADFLAATYALFGLGARPVFALPAHRETELAHLVRGSRARFHLTTVPLAGVGSTALEPAGPEPADVVPAADGGAEDVAFLQLSGGTTGLPKLIPRTHRDYAYSFLRSAELCRVDESTVFLAVLPMSHNFTMSSPGFLAVLSLGGTVVTTTDPSPSAVFDLVARHRVTMVAAVPPLAQLWLDSPAREAADLTSLDVLLVGGARFAQATAERVRPELGCDLQQVYGMAEGLVCYTRREDPYDVVVGSQGRPMSDLDEVRVVDDEDRPLPPGTPGHLLVRGPYTIRGYFAAPGHNAASFTDDGFYRTGDVVRADEAGNLTVVGRGKEQINRGGEKVAPAEVEGLLLVLDAIHDVCVVGVPDDVLGERVEAYVVAHPGRAGELTTPALRRHLRGRVADYKIPERFHLVDHLPGTGVGKVSRRGVAARYFQPADGER